MKLVVTDTGPLLHLHQIGAVELVSKLGEVHATPKVWEELQHHAPNFSAIAPSSWLKVYQPSAAAAQTASQWVQARILHAGEAEALAYAQEIRADFFLTDDTAARAMGESLGLQVRGSLGVILFAAASGILDQTMSDKTLANLEQHSSLWMSSKVKSAARNALAKIFAKG